MFHTLDISTSGLVAQRHRLDTIAGNIANINTTRDERGNLSPFQRRLLKFTAAEQNDQTAGQRGVGVQFEVEIDRETEPRKVYDPQHPDADAGGNVAYPNIDLVKEFVNALEASRAYEANVAVIDISKTMSAQTLKLLG